MTERRRESLTGRLAKLGLTDAAEAERRLQGHDLDDELLDALSIAADPDLALLGLLRLLEVRDIRAELAKDSQARDRLLAVLGVSAALGDHLVRHPDHWRVLAGPGATHRPTAGELREALLHAVGASDDAPPRATAPRATAPDAVIALRVAYRKALLHLAGRDLVHEAAVEDVAAELADLASAALEAGLAIARTELGDRAGLCRLAVIGMGKCGGRELNYVSDVDVVFVAEPAPGQDEDAALRAATRLAAGMMRACSDSTTEGALWEVDAALRPEGRSGPLVRTLASHQAYYERWAKTWEYQALLKARPVAGDRELGQKYVDTLAPLVWRAAERDNFVEDVQAMRRRVEENIPPEEAVRQLKLGPGGLRDVEFAVQLLQLVHGRADEELRGSNTLNALKKLSWGGYVGRADAAALGTAYRFLRRVEHLIQLHRLRRTHLVPDDPRDLRRLGRALGLRTEPVAEFTAEWRRHAREVRRLHEKLFYRPLLRAVARLPGEEVRLTREAARARLVALGYTDPAGALRHLEALTAGVSRRAAIQRTLLPVMLGWFADGPDPDAGLLGFRQVSDALGTTPWYLRLLRDDVGVAERMARVLASSRYATDLLLRAPEAVAMLGGEGGGLTPRSYDALRTEAQAAVRRHSTPEPARRHPRPPADAETGGHGPADAAPPEGVSAGSRDPAGEVPSGDAGAGERGSVVGGAAAGERDSVGAAPDGGAGAGEHGPVRGGTSAERRDSAGEASAPGAGAGEHGRVRGGTSAGRRDSAGEAAVPGVDAEGRGRAARERAEGAVTAVRGLRRRELFRTAAADLLGLLDDRSVAEALTAITTVTIEAALLAAVDVIEAERDGPLPTRVAIVAMGRYGGYELGYGSDADVMFVHDPLPGTDEREASEAAHAVAEELRRLLALPAPDPPLVIDPGLRPEGRQGPLVRTLDSYASYYRRWSAPWESQALLRAAPIVGDAGLRERFRALVDPVRWPDHGIDEAALREIRRLKARMEAERLPRGVDRRLHTKLGPGGLSDVEWVAQLLQLRHAYEVPGLRTTRTLAALDAAVDAGLLAQADARTLTDAWRMATRIRNATMLVRGRASDLLPTEHHRERSAVAAVLGYPASGSLLEDYQRHARHARQVVERVFYGAEG